MIFSILSLLVIFSAFVYWWFSNRSKYFERLGIEFDNSLPFGSFKNVIFQRENFLDGFESVYKKFNSG